MLSKLSALTLLLPFASGLTLTTPTNLTSGGQATISWVTAAGDPSTWSFELINTDFNDAFAIANNVQPSLNSITIGLPVVPVGAGYTLEAVNISDINQVFATSGGFSVGPGISSSSSSTLSASGSFTSGSSTSGSGTTITTSGASSGFGTTVTTPPSSTSGASSTGSSSTGSATTPATSNFNAATSLSVGFGGAAKYGVAFLAAIAGAAAFAL